MADFPEADVAEVRRVVSVSILDGILRLVVSCQDDLPLGICQHAIG